MKCGRIDRMRNKAKWFYALVVVLVLVVGIVAGGYVQRGAQHRWEERRYRELGMKEPKNLSPFEREELKQLTERLINHKIDNQNPEPIDRP